MYYVYLITNALNNRKYIGVSNNPDRRFKEHLKRATNVSEDGCKRLSRAIRKYGADSFKIEILYETDERLSAFDAEVFYISLFGSYEFGYNASKGGEGSDRIQPWKKGTKGAVIPNSGSFIGGQFSGEKHVKSKLSDKDRFDIWNRKLLGESANDLAKEYGVYPSTIHRIKRFIKRQQTG